MIFFVLQILYACVRQFYWVEEPRNSLYGFPSSWVDTVVNWTSRLVNCGLLDHWIFTCPAHLSVCCPKFSLPLEEDFAVVDRLTHLTPLHAFGYVLIRRLAEMTARLATCWLLATWMAITVIWTVRKGCACYYSTDGKEKNSNFKWKSLLLPLLLSAVPLTIVLSCLAETALGDVQTIPSHSFPSFAMSLWRFPKAFGHTEQTTSPSVLELLRFSSLHQTLYERSEGGDDGSSRLCRHVARSLSYWSVLLFTGTFYSTVTATIYWMVWRPLRRLCSMLFSTDKKCGKKFPDQRVKCDVTTQIDPEFLIPKQDSLRTKPERGGGRPPLAPRYISRGTYTCTYSSLGKEST